MRIKRRQGLMIDLCGEINMLFTTVIKDNKSFQRCYRSGRYAVCGYVCAYFYPNGTPFNRLGITAGKKLGNAVCRNRVKRIVRAAYRICETEIPMGYDIVFVGRNDAAMRTSAEMEGFIRKKLISEIDKAAENGAFTRTGKKGKGR